MRQFLKRLLGVSATTEPVEASDRDQKEILTPADTRDETCEPKWLGYYPEREREYFATLHQLREAISKRDYSNAARFARENLRHLPAFVPSIEERYHCKLPHVVHIPVLKHGGTILALVGDTEGLMEMRATVLSIPELALCIPAVEQHVEDMRLFEAILQAVAEKPGCIQSSMKGLIGAEDGHRVAYLISWLEKAGKIRRIRRGLSYSLVIAGSPHDEDLPPKRLVGSHRMDRHSPQCRDIDLSTLPYVPLPRAPHRWEAKRDDAAGEVGASGWFEIRGAEDWELLSVDKIPFKQRPDPAFRRIHPTDTGLIMLDDLGKSSLSNSAPASALSYGRNGDLQAEAPLLHDVYRLGVNAMGDGLIAMSRDCVVHAYDSNLSMILESSLLQTPEVRALQQRLQIKTESLRTHIRCVAIAFDNSRYLFTGVDEAWCVDMEGIGLWGVKLPLKEGWSRVEQPSTNYGTSADVKHALKVMGMAFPFTPMDFKQRYRELVKQWHPDLNPGNAEALEHMQAINVSAEILSGIDQTALARYAGAMFTKDLRTAKIRVQGWTSTISAALMMDELQAADWVYAANFAGASHDVFLAGYSGKVVHLTADGEPVRVYDIGAVPRRIVDTGDYLYFLTDTRHYTLQGESLIAVIDTSEGGDLLVAQTGFGLLEKRRFRWFRYDGMLLGTVVTKNPIRRVYQAPAGMVVETRQRRAMISGVRPWWE
jgi:hypothetical protein